MKKFLRILLASIWIFFLFSWVFAADSLDITNNWETFDLNTLFVNDYVEKGSDWTVKVKNFSQAVWAIVQLITWIIWWFAVLWTILWGFMILISWWSDDLITKWKSYIKFSLLWLAFSLISYTLIQLVQLFLFSFSN